MALTSLSSIRRQEFRKAAFEVLQTEGVPGTTLEKVAQRAGASKSILLHYFASKQELLEHALRYSESLVRADVVRRLRIAHTPSERLWAVIDANFSPSLFCFPVCHAWLSLCVESPRNPQLQRVQRACHARTRSNLLSAVKQLCAPEDVEGVIATTIMLIDGLWFQAGLRRDALHRDDALSEIYQYLQFRIPHAAVARESMNSA